MSEACRLFWTHADVVADGAEQAVALSCCLAGQRVRISGFDGGAALRSRLCALGLGPGMTVEVVAAAGGPMILNVMGSRVMLGRGLARKVKVRPIGG